MKAVRIGAGRSWLKWLGRMLAKTGQCRRGQGRSKGGA